MKRPTGTLLATLPLLAACAASYPTPTRPAADARAAERNAVELGANSDPSAQLYVKMADEELQQADHALADGDNKRAHFLLVRAKADADLAVALTKQTNAKRAAQRAEEMSKKIQSQMQNNPGGER